MTINKNSVEQINVALLDMDKKIKSALSNGTSASDFKNLEASVDNIKRTLNETTAGLEPGKTYDINISGNAATADKATTATTAETATNANHAETATTAETATNANHALTADTATNVTTANKVANALTVNGKTYDGSSAVNAGVQTVANGGTGVTTQADINKAFIGNLDKGESDVTDGTEFVSSCVSNNGFSEPRYVNTPFRRKFSAVWGYIKGKISSVLGLTKDNYGGKASTAGTADKAGTADTADNLTAGAALNGYNTITTTNPTKIGAGQIKVHTVYGAGGPALYGNLINIGGSGGFQFFVEWTSTQNQAGQDLIGHIFTRFWRDNQSAWTAWKELAYNTGDVIFTTAKASNKMVIPIGAPSQLEDGCIWIS